MSLTKRSQAKVDSILTSGRHLFNEFGFNKVTMDSICIHANVSKGTLYKYYSDKQDLYESIIKQIYDQERERFTNIIYGEGSFLVKIKHVIEERVNKYTNTHKKFFEDYFNRSADLDAYMKQYILDVKSLRKHLYDEGRAQGYIAEKISNQTLELYFEIIQLGLSSKYHDLSELPKDSLTNLLELIYAGMVSNCLGDN